MSYRNDSPADFGGMGVMLMGTGGRAEPYVRALSVMREARLVGVVEEAGALRPARSHDIRWTTEMGEALSWPDVEGVIVCSPFATGASPVATAAEAGKHVLVDAPLAESATQLWHLQDVFATEGLALMPATPARFENHAVSVRAAIERGDLGRVVFLRHVELGASIDPGDVFDLVTWWIGDSPASVYAQSPPSADTGSDDDYASVTVHFLEGSTAVCEFGQSGAAIFQEVYLLGTTAALTVPGNGGSNVVVGGQGATAISTPPVELARRQLVSWTRAAQHTQSGATMGDAAMADAVAVAMEQSLDRGGPMRVDSATKVGG